MRGTYILETTGGVASQCIERKQPSKGHSPTGDHRGIDKSGHRKKESNQVRGTHPLKTTEQVTSQDTERK